MCQVPVERPQRRTYRYEDYDHDAEVRGGLIALKCRQKFPSRQSGGRRGIVTSFSRQARHRMLKMIATIDWREARTGVFITLTFPDSVLPMYKSERMRLLREFFRRMENYLGHKVSALWRVEWVPRESGFWKGTPMPHFHLIVFSVRYFPYNVCNWTWKSILGLECWDYVRTECKRLANEKAHGSYVAKYAAKLPLSLVSVAYSRIDGRHWGYHRLKKLPRAESKYFGDVPKETVLKLRSIAGRTVPGYREDQDLGFCIFTRFGRHLVREVENLLLDSDATVY